MLHVPPSSSNSIFYLQQPSDKTGCTLPTIPENQPRRTYQNHLSSSSQQSIYPKLIFSTLILHCGNKNYKFLRRAPLQVSLLSPEYSLPQRHVYNTHQIHFIFAAHFPPFIYPSSNTVVAYTPPLI